jgi:hypothetical protein
MAIFPILDAENKVQVNDKTRLGGAFSFLSKDEAAITLVEIEPVAGNGFIDVFTSAISPSDYFLDWSYPTDGTAVASLRITTDGAPVTVTKNVEVVTEANDKLFSTDQDIIRYEAEVMDLMPDGYSSFNYMHRKVQTLILDWFNEEGYRLTGNEKITADEILDKDEVRRWSESWVLSMIYADNSNSIDDKFMEKARFYESRSIDSRRRSIIQLDLNKDGEITDGEFIRPMSLDIFRR